MGSSSLAPAVTFELRHDALHWFESTCTKFAKV